MKFYLLIIKLIHLYFKDDLIFKGYKFVYKKYILQWTFITSRHAPT